MTSKLKIWTLFILMSATLVGCATSANRNPASVQTDYDSERVRLLTEAAQNGILFQFDEANFHKDLPRIQIASTCNKPLEEIWGDQFFDILRTFSKYPDLYKKIHMIQIRQSETPSVDMSIESDGTTALILGYQKISRRETFSDKWRSSCPNGVSGHDQVELNLLEWPVEKKIVDLLRGLRDKTPAGSERFTFDNTFLIYLAQRQALLRMNPNLHVERNRHGKYILPTILNNLAAQSKNGRYPNMEFWLRKIDNVSLLGGQVKFFNIIQQKDLMRGIALDGVSLDENAEKSVSLNQVVTSTYMFVSYRSTGGEYTYSTLSQLNQCLKDFNPESSPRISSKPENFLFPGYACTSE